ncbi:MAG: c-type cytochrome [Planctomycetota bacterium]
MTKLRWCLAAAALCAPSSAAQEIDADALFQTNCASCHGEKGDGDGWTQLDRPARSFRDGGFSYGNTPDALFRTITYGIPGTPMPSFESSLSEPQREALAAHVVSLGPPIEAVDPEQTVLAVADKPVFVRGYLPPIADGLKPVPRGLLLGRPEGFTFEYRADDVRLLGLRQGGFVDRRDWTGRGGTALQPLGRVVHLVEDGAPRAPFRLAGFGPLAAKLRSTWIDAQAGGLSYELRADGAAVARVREVPAPAGSSLGAGFSRRFELEALRAGTVFQRLQAYGAAVRVDSFATPGREWTVRRREDGMYEVAGVSLAPDGRSFRQNEGVYEVRYELEPGAKAAMELTALVAYDWNDELAARFREEVSR